MRVNGCLTSIPSCSGYLSGTDALRAFFVFFVSLWLNSVPSLRTFAFFIARERNGLARGPSFEGRCDSDGEFPSHRRKRLPEIVLHRRNPTCETRAKVSM